jgi:hypothetical protein
LAAAFLLVAFFLAVRGFPSRWLALFLVPGCSDCHASSCRRRLARNFFSLEDNFDFAFGRQLPWLLAGFPLTGSYPGQQRFLLVGIVD